MRIPGKTVALMISLTLTACASVDVVRLTNQTYPSKASAKEVEVLQTEPTRPHIRIAELSLSDSDTSFEKMQNKILKKAATLGADAVVFSHPVSYVKHQVAYEPNYSPWGYYGPYSGPGAWGYGGFGYSGWGYGGMSSPLGWGGYTTSTAVPYDVTVNSLTCTAFKYTNSNEPVK
jgi:hypothetical protein